MPFNNLRALTLHHCASKLRPETPLTLEKDDWVKGWDCTEGDEIPPIQNFQSFPVLLLQHVVGLCHESNIPFLTRGLAGSYVPAF